MFVKLVLIVLLVSFYGTEALADEGQTYAENVRTNAAFPCPEPEDIAPCTCSVPFDGANPDLICSNVESNEQLASVFQASFPVQNFRRFYINDNENITALTDIFGNITFQDLNLNVVPNLQFVSNYLLVKSENTLERIEIRDSKLSKETFPIPLIQTFTKLYYFQMEVSLFDAWPKLESESITTVAITSSPITELPSDSFDLLPQIIDWYMYQNNIAKLNANTFHLKNRYNTIVAWGMELATIEPGTFVLPNFTDNNCSVHLELSTNQLTLVEEEVFGAIAPYLSSLYLFDNPLVCGCDMAWLITNPEYLSKVDSLATCSNGTSLFELDPQQYINNC